MHTLTERVTVRPMKAPSTSSVSECLRLLQALKPEWAIEYKYEEEDENDVLRVFVYKTSASAKESRGFDDLLQVKTLAFPYFDGKMVFRTPIEWAEEMTRRLLAKRPSMHA